MAVCLSTGPEDTGLTIIGTKNCFRKGMNDDKSVLQHSARADSRPSVGGHPRLQQLSGMGETDETGLAGGVG